MQTCSFGLKMLGSYIVGIGVLMCFLFCETFNSLKYSAFSSDGSRRFDPFFGDGRVDPCAPLFIVHKFVGNENYTKIYCGIARYKRMGAAYLRPGPEVVHPMRSYVGYLLEY